MASLHLGTVVVVVVLVVLGSADPTPAVHTHRDGKFLFATNPVLCEGSAGHQGACLPYFQCDTFDGVVEGTCQVVGQCCVVQRTCGEESPARITYFNSNNYTGSTSSPCKVDIKPSTALNAPDICQLHLSFDKMELSEPSAEGECDSQYLEVKGGKEDSFKVCGTNKGQNMVLDVAGLDGPFSISVVTSKALDTESYWEVKVVQVPCDSADLAPSGCDQYVTGSEGEIKSFNYATKATTKKHVKNDKEFVGSRHLQESYTVCLRQEEGKCGVKWSAKTDDKYAFTLTGNLGSDVSEFSEAVNEVCPFTDYLVITEATVAGEEEEADVVFCGSAFPKAVITSSFRVRVEANKKEVEDEDIDNRGFHLVYEQQDCS